MRTMGNLMSGRNRYLAGSHRIPISYDGLQRFMVLQQNQRESLQIFPNEAFQIRTWHDSWEQRESSGKNISKNRRILSETHEEIVKVVYNENMRFKTAVQF